VLGHEGAGVVEAIGSEVTRVRPGDHVVITTIAACGMCRYCNIGKPTWCRQTLGNRGTPFSVGGEPVGNFAATSTFTELTLIKEIQAVPIGTDIPFTSACLIACGVTTGLGAVLNRANVLPGQTAAVFGLGGVGLSAVQGLRLKGASRIIAVDTLASKAELAERFGATDFVLAGSVDVADEIRALLPYSATQRRGPFGAGGVDWAIECTGNLTVLDSALDSLDWGGTAVAVGQPSAAAKVAVTVANLLQVDRGLIGTRAGGIRPHHDIPMVVDLYRQGLFDLDSMVSKTYPLEGFDELCDDMHEGRIARGVLNVS
jgi:Zn-dependent alcohol dehydrogenase